MAYVPTGRPPGRPRLPDSEKRRRGNPGKRPLAETGSAHPLSLHLAEPGAHPEPHRPLGSHGRQCWDRLLGGGHWLTSGDLEMVMLTCETVDERAGLRLAVLRDGGKFDRQALRAIERQISTLLGSLAFTPTDRARMGLGEVPEPTNELDRLRSKRHDYPKPPPRPTSRPL